MPCHTKTTFVLEGEQGQRGPPPLTRSGQIAQDGEMLVGVTVLLHMIWSHHPSPPWSSLTPAKIQDKLQNSTHYLQGPQQPGSTLPLGPPPPTHPQPPNLLQVPTTKCRTWGEMAFLVAAPTLWNSLRPNIKNAPTLLSFKKALKTHLLRLSFPSNPPATPCFYSVYLFILYFS